jgi:hypothetical protein
MSDKPPDLQQWINAAGGYHAVDWKAWHAANAEWRRQQFERLERDMGKANKQTAPTGRRHVVGE